MEFLREYGLLIAVATPVVVVAALQVYLFVAGERGTLLLPSLAPFESIPVAAEPVAVAEAGTGPRSTVGDAVNDHADERLAA